MPTTTPTQSSAAQTPRPLRFCMVTTFYPPHNFGGDGIFIERLAKVLARHGHHVTVIYCIDAYKISGGTAHASETDNDSADGIDVHAIRSFAGPLSPLVTHQLAIPALKHNKLAKIFSENAFDVTHFHNVSLIGGPGILDYGSGVKLYTAHEYWLVCPLSTLWTYADQPCVSKRCVRCTLRSGKPPQWWRFTSLLEKKLQQLDAIIAPSQFSIDKHREFGLDLDFVHLPNFLPLEAPSASTAPSTVPASRPFFLMVGRLEQSKGFHNIINFFATYNDADLIVVGTGQYETELARIAQGHDHIKLMGHLPYETLRGLYRAATAVIVPSIWDEPFGLIVLEAFAQSTPVVVNHAGALPELVAASNGGLIYSNPNELEQAITDLLDDPHRAQTLGENGHTTYLAQWTDTRHLQDYLALIEAHAPHLQNPVDHAQRF